MDWIGLNADVERILTKHYTPGRNGSIKAVTIHHMGGNLSIDGCYSTWQTREASAHYAVQADGTIGQLVNDWDTAWACANAWANSNTISIEHANNQFGPWTVNDTVLDQGAHLVAAICRKYGLGRPEWLVNVFPHSHWSATDCPGELQRSQNAEYMARAQAWYDGMGGGAAPYPAPSPAPSVGIPDLRYRVRTANGVLPEMVEKYDVKERLQMDYAPRKIAVPQGGIRQEPFRVERQHLDGNHHVNNGQYISMAMAYLPENFAIRQMRAEYKKSALLHDIVVPIIVTEADRVTVSLCSEDEAPFVVVELTGR